MREYLTFSLAGDRYAFSIEDVDSVVEAEGFTRLPQDAPYMRGIMNLRGAVIPVVDLRLKFELAEAEGRAAGSRAAESVIVLCLKEGGEDRLVGAVADEVHEVLALDEALIEAPPSALSAKRGDGAFVSGIGKSGSGFIVILDAAALHAERARACA